MSLINLQDFENKGWVIVDIPEKSYLNFFIERLEFKCREFLGPNSTLKSVDKFLKTNEELKDFQSFLTNYLWDNEFSLNFVKSIKPFTDILIGLNLMVQFKPFLRIARPGNRDDNIGFHKDTQYGQSPYELAVHVPFVDLDESSSLQVISGSHLHDEKNYTSIKSKNLIVSKGSLEHSLGKPYAPKNLAIPENANPDFLDAKVGQVAIFSPALFHGQEINNGNHTRVTTDLRIVDSNKSGLNIKIGKVHTGYISVFDSPVEKIAAKYFQSQNS